MGGKKDFTAKSEVEHHGFRRKPREQDDSVIQVLSSGPPVGNPISTFADDNDETNAITLQLQNIPNAVPSTGTIVYLFF